MLISKNTRNSVISGATWTTVSSILEKIIGLISISILARLIEPKDFGVVAIAIIAIGIVSTFSDIGFEGAIIQRIDNVERAASTAFYIVIYLSLVNYIILYLLAKPIAEYYSEVIIEDILKVIASTILIGAFTRVHNFLLSRNLAFKQKAICEIISSISYVAVAVPLAQNGFGVWSIAYAEVIKNITRSFIILFVSKWQPQFVFDRKIARELIGYGKHIMYNNMLTFLSENIDNALVGRFLGLTSLSFYKMSYNAANLPSQISYQVIGRVALPALSRMQNNMDSLTTTYFKIFRCCLYVIVPVFFGLYVLGAEFIRILYGSKWLAATPLFKILLLFGFASSIRMFMNILFISTGKAMFLPRITIIRLSLLLVVLFLSKIYGLLFLCMSVSIIEILILIVQISLVKHQYSIGYRAYIDCLYKPLISSIIMIFIVSLVRDSYLSNISCAASIIFSTALGIATYFIVLLFIDKELLNYFKRIKSLSGNSKY